MALDTPVPHAALVKAIVETAGDDSTARGFLSLLYANAAADMLSLATADGLGREGLAALDLARTRPRGHHALRLRDTHHIGDGRTQVLEVVNDDMPFLVDSIVGELSAHNVRIHLVLHPILKVERDGQGRLERIIGPGDRNWSDGHQESFIAILIDRLEPAQASALCAAVSATLDDVRIAVTDWQPMLARLDKAVAALEANPPPVPPGQLAETLSFCRWLRDGQLTFLGVREHVLEGGAEAGDLYPVAGSGLGVLRDPTLLVLSRNGEPLRMTADIRRHLTGTDPLIITKSNVLSHVHRRVPMDFVGLKTYAPSGEVTGELRFVGLLTSQAYTQPARQIPLVRHKVASVIEASGFPPASHDGKALANVLDQFPRDELLQMSVDALKTWAAAVLDLELRPRVRVLTRSDRFDRFVSALVFVPRDRYSTTARERIGAILCEAFDGRISSFTPHYSDGPLVRVHFVVGRNDRPDDAPNRADLAANVIEARVAETIRSWEDRLSTTIEAAGAPLAGTAARYATAFSAGYSETYSAARALEDIRRIERLGPDRPVVIDFYPDEGMPAHRLRAAIYRYDSPMPLSERVPVLENLGFSSIDERTHRITPDLDGATRVVALHDMVVESVDGAPIDLAAIEDRLEDAVLAVFRGDADNDGFNRLVIAAGADWREAAMLRAIASYLRQIGAPFGQGYVAATLHRHAGVARDLIELFRTRFDPALSLDMAQRTEREAAIVARIEGALAGVSSLDEDRILRRCVNVLRSILRTNYFQKDANGGAPPVLAFKIDSKRIDELPEPRPYREIWVSGPRVEGVHLRFAAIARGGIRWSDRAQDFRTEVLGLCKAQQVKNTVIVPSGSKGGFVPRHMPRSGTREEIMREGIAAYRLLIGSLLDITDNLVDGQVSPPVDVVRHDADDPYLVVAADKGTATFSDIANELSLSRRFWLGDAFASGGSAGYDHKKMGITARGGWECVKRHFREIDIDIQTTPFRAAGVGDMSGDVFGNGMLLSPAIRLVAAFDHRDILLDPEPDIATSYAERQRMFALPRSSWQDYDQAKLSAGGGIFSRAAKSIPLSPQVRRLLGLEADRATPADVLRAILKLDVDLLWLGGIGTYVRASSETDAEAGDRANDAIRITGAELKARVVGEGANLGLTQKGRIEYARAGGRLNTDFIDNSAGVNSSDLEVNIKIALGSAIAGGRLATADRNAFLASMTDDVAAACLVNNHQQSLALSLAERRGARDMGYLSRLMRALETRGFLDRRIESLPRDAEMRQREAAGAGLTRPELAVLLSWSKIALDTDLLASSVPDDPANESLLFSYMPPPLAARLREDVIGHRLRREIVAMRITNSMINRGGPTFAVRLADATGRSVAEIAHAYLAARELYSLPALWRDLDALDGRIPGALQLSLYADTQEFLIEQTASLLRSGGTKTLTGLLAAHRPVAEGMTTSLAEVVTASHSSAASARRQALVDGGVPDAIASAIATLPLMGRVPAIAALASGTARPLTTIAKAVFAADGTLRLDDIKSRAASIPTADYYDRLAVNGAIGSLEQAARALARRAVSTDPASGEVSAADAAASASFARAKAALDEVADAGEVTVSRLVVAASQVRDLAGG